MQSDDNNQKVTLGCGTLILIALIVLIFSNAGNDEINTELRQLQLKINNLESAVEKQNREITKLRATIEGAKAKAGGGDVSAEAPAKVGGEDDN